MASRFRHEDREAVPKGWKVRTVKAGAHRVRVAFPPGRRQKGSGRLVSILHPVGENPCGLKSTNPAELMVMGANPPRHRLNAATRYRVVLIPKSGSPNWVTKEYDTKREAKDFKKTVDQKAFRVIIRKVYRENPAELVVMGANPRVEVVHGANPPVEEIAEEFSGTEVEWIDVYNEPHIPKGRYAYLAKLFRLLIKPVKGGQVQRITFEGDGMPLIVSDSTAKQIYFVDGNQDISSCLRVPGSSIALAGGSIHPDSAFGERERSEGLLELGQAREIHYIGKKHHIGDEDTDEWRHTHGEENGVLPTVLFDPRNKRLLYEAGDYRIEGPWIKN